ncbi:hypothetical protein [Scytonema sp. NUACC21]
MNLSHCYSMPSRRTASQIVKPHWYSSFLFLVCVLSVLFQEEEHEPEQVILETRDRR